MNTEVVSEKSAKPSQREVMNIEMPAKAQTKTGNSKKSETKEKKK